MILRLEHEEFQRRERRVRGAGWEERNAKGSKDAMSAKDEEAVPSPVPPEPTSRRQRLAARLFAPKRFSAALAMLWFTVALAYMAVFPLRGGVVQSFGGPVTLAFAGNTFTPVQNPGAFVGSRLGSGQGQELWECLYDFEVEHTRYRTVLRCRFDVPVRLDMTSTPLGPPPANLIPAARQEFADHVRDQYMTYPYGGEFMDMLVAGQAKRILWRRNGKARLAADWLAPLLLIMLGLMYTVSAIRRAAFKRRYSRCRRGLCPICRYSLTDLTSSTCPECGCNTAATCAQAARLLGAAETHGGGAIVSREEPEEREGREG